MKIAIEAQRIFRTNKHGMDFVALESIRELQKIDKENEYFIFVSPGEDHCLEETSNTHIVEVKCPTYPLWEQVALPRAVAKIRPDLLHCTSNTAPIHCPVPLVLTLHDIIFLEPKQGGNTSWYQNMGWHYRRLVVPRILPKCKRIITVSHFERDRIREALCLPKEQIMAIYNGYSQHFHPLSGISAITHKYIHSDDYLFFLGNTDPEGIQSVSQALIKKASSINSGLTRRQAGYDIERAAYRGNQALPVLPRLHLQQGFGILVQWGLRLPIHLPKGKLRYPHARSYGMRYTRDNGEYLGHA